MMMRRLLSTLVVLGLALLAAPMARAIPPIQEARLDNGLRVLLMEAHNVPMVVMRLTTPAGSRFDPEGHGGAAAMLATMLADHTARRDYRAWADWLDARALRLGADADRDSLSIGVTTLTETLNDAVAALAEAALAPGWDKKRFAILKSDALAAARKSLETPDVRAAEVTLRLLYPHHGYGHRPDGSVNSLARVTLDDLKGIYRRQFRPQGAVLAVSGDVTMKKLLRLLRPALKGWRGRPEQALRDVTAPAPTKPRRVHVPMPTRQTTAQLARLGPSRYSRDFFADMLLNHILGGGGFSSRLMDEVREQRGLVYGVYSYFVPLAAPGPFVISLKTRADQTNEALKVVRRVMREMHAGKITARQLAAAQANLAGGFAHRLDSNAKRVSLMSMIGFYGLPLDYLQRWQARIRGVTLAEVRAAARRFLDPAAWSVVTVGPGKG